MPIQRRVKDNRINYEQVAKLILLCSQTHKSDAEANQNRFIVREGLIQKMVGMPLSHDDRFYIIREFNLLGWQVAINPDYWLIFVVDEEQLFKWDEATYPYGLEQTIKAVQQGKEPPLGELDDYYRLKPNLTAKFLGWSDEDIQEQLVEEALNGVEGEVEEEYEETGDKSLLNIKDDDEIGFTNFTAWEYLDYELARNGLVFKSK
ncbi:hypothetical protein WOC12_22875 [Vibrio parahaemolyticus]|nr:MULTISPECIES: hypothetical protein [Vibrio]MDW2234990.1 hypothetical protein [Vibrio sp. 1565-1]ANZ13284.1 hypothetical protein VpaChn25_PB28 [Vibrio parahaemolyticus]MCG9230210.1 hypothetical protein [Vibrio diabolicus]MCG9573534.1 hypothetical protein [Vibrio diabolicus]MCR9649674.1 hypothetical protein [Vibrio parahaemolyticus]